MRAKDIMQTRVTQIGPDDPLLSVHRLFCDEEISGAPVVSETGELLGVLTIRDLLRDHRDGIDAPDRTLEYFRDDHTPERPRRRSPNDELFDRLTTTTAAEVMSPEVISVTPDADVSEITRLILENRIHRVLVVEPTERGKSLCGIISVFDLVQVLS